MPMTAVALKPCARGSFSWALTKGCAGLAPAAAAVVLGAFAAQDGAVAPAQKGAVIIARRAMLQDLLYLRFHGLKVR